jgi:hypothetical protein
MVEYAEQYWKRNIKISFMVTLESHKPSAKMIAESHNYWSRGITGAFDKEFCCETRLLLKVTHNISQD